VISKTESAKEFKELKKKKKHIDNIKKLNYKIKNNKFVNNYKQQETIYKNNLLVY
jgi:hypothetical protein